MEEKEKLVKCDTCNKEVSERDIDRVGDCRTCRANDKATDMTVGDLNARR